VLVIVVLAFVGILATVALYTSITNFQMKVTDRNVTNSFYSAEGVLDQIRVGLQNDVSEALGKAYTETMKQYASLTEDERESLFSSKYIGALRLSLNPSGSITLADGTAVDAQMLCEIGKLKNYIASTVRPQVNLKNGKNDPSDCCFLNVTTSGLVIKDLVVEFTDDTDNLSIIQTDILLQIPDLNMVGSANAPQVFDYPLIGNAGVEFLGQNTTVKGSVYAGSQYALNAVRKDGTTEEDYYKSLVIADTSTVNFTQAPYVIADGDLWVNGITGSSYAIETNKSGQVWARNINLKDSTALLSGTTYVWDDMTLLGDGSQVKIAGTYAGYGSSTVGDDGSSAIIINGKNSVLDMSEAKSVVVAGYAYINTGNISTKEEGKTNSDVQLGESIMVKGDQIAYLVPTECVATVGGDKDTEGTSRYKKNPLTVAEYNAVEADDTCTLVDFNVTTKTGHTLATYFGADASVDTAIRKVWVPSKTGNPDDGLVYLYLNMDAKTASQYFMDYYKAGDDKLKKYNAFYTDGINAIGENTTINTAGTYVEYTEDKSSGKDVPLTLKYDTGTDTINGTGSLADIYDALTTKLVSDPAEITELDYDTVFENVIDKAFLKDFLKNCTNKTFTASQSGTGGQTLYVVMVDNEGGDPYVFEDDNNKHVYIIVATGDVYINESFTGTVIADGKVKIGTKNGIQTTDNITVQKTTTENIKKLLLVLCENNNSQSVNLYTFFRDGSVYISNGFTGSSSGSTASDEVELSNLITYQNWKKK
jgi:hypothetical protein